ncbi:acyl carrier protein [Streptomyces sp. NPDC088387]|uniref:acyl carrier protein n=1 Tax=Streptomyces sp. NPDC088387 TaxID=3365859 RepID=UPI0038220DD6
MPSVEPLVLDVVKDVLGINHVEAGDSFYDFGGSSLQAMRVCVRLERDLGFAVDPELLLDSDSLGDFAQAVARAGATAQHKGPA